jgi:hypothetical protein
MARFGYIGRNSARNSADKPQYSAPRSLSWTMRRQRVQKSEKYHLFAGATLCVAHHVKKCVTYVCPLPMHREGETVQRLTIGSPTDGILSAAVTARRHEHITREQRETKEVDTHACSLG